MVFKGLPVVLYFEFIFEVIRLETQIRPHLLYLIPGEAFPEDTIVKLQQDVANLFVLFKLLSPKQYIRSLGLVTEVNLPIQFLHIMCFIWRVVMIENKFNWRGFVMRLRKIRKILNLLDSLRCDKFIRTLTAFIRTAPHEGNDVDRLHLFRKRYEGCLVEVDKRKFQPNQQATPRKEI